MKINTIETKEILEFEKEIGHELVANTRPIHSEFKTFYVNFKSCEQIDKTILRSIVGDGNTIDSALKDYCKQVSCRMMVFNAFGSNRREVLFPKLIHTKLLKK